MNKEKIFVNGFFKRLIGLRFKKKKDLIGKIFVFKLKKSVSYLDIDTAFIFFPIRVKAYYCGVLVKDFVMEPFSLVFCNFYVDEIREELLED